MRIMIVGSTGMLGQALVNEGRRRGLEMVGVARSGAELPLDIRDDENVARTIADIEPDLIVNTAAITDIGRCEAEPGEAYLVNARAVAILADAALRRGARLVQISTDHYFVGDGPGKHAEDARVRLVNEYARTKYAGEYFALTAPEALIVRTNIAGFRGLEGRPTFAEWVFAALQSGEAVSVFDDFFTSTIDVGHCAAALFDLLGRRVSGVVNLASSEVASKAEFIELLARRLGSEDIELRPASVRALSPRRAESLGLDVSRAERLLGRGLPGLDATVDALVNAYRSRS
jgi:dTDP-4-dehydrorhamnose reductase